MKIILLTIITLMGFEAKGVSIAKELQGRSISGCSAFNKISFAHVSESTIAWTSVIFPGPNCSGTPTTKSITFQITEKIESRNSPGDITEKVKGKSGNSTFPIQISRSWDAHQVVVNLQGGSKSHWGYFWDGNSSLVSQHLTYNKTVGNKCFLSNDWGFSLKSYHITLEIYPTHFLVSKFWFKNPNCNGPDIEERDVKKFLIQAAEPNGDTEIITLDSGDTIRIQTSKDKWIVTGSPILNGEYTVPDQTRFNSRILRSAMAPNAWKTVDPLATQKD